MTEQERRRFAELERDQAQARLDDAKRRGDSMASVAVNESVNRAVAEDAASEAKVRANVAESRERSMATSAGIARQEASYERAAASNATFTTVMIAIGALALVTVIGYFAWWQPNHQVNASTNTFIRTDKTIEKASPSPNVIVKQPNVNVKVIVPEAAPKAEETPAADSSPAPDKVDGTGNPSDSNAGKAPETKPGTDNP